MSRSRKQAGSAEEGTRHRWRLGLALGVAATGFLSAGAELSAVERPRPLTVALWVGVAVVGCGVSIAEGLGGLRDRRARAKAGRPAISVSCAGSAPIALPPLPGSAVALWPITSLMTGRRCQRLLARWRRCGGSRGRQAGRRPQAAASRGTNCCRLRQRRRVDHQTVDVRLRAGDGQIVQDHPAVR
jgi:hypothetical protein